MGNQNVPKPPIMPASRNKLTATINIFSVLKIYLWIGSAHVKKYIHSFYCIFQTEQQIHVLLQQ